MSLVSSHEDHYQPAACGLVGPLAWAGRAAQDGADPRLGWDPLKFPDGARAGAALLLVYPHDDTLHFTLTVRGSGLRNHTGQVSLPGGRVDEGESFEEAALRETQEEIGVDPQAVELLGRLTPLHIPVSGYILNPLVGFTAMRPAFQRAEWEVARIIEAPCPAAQRRAHHQARSAHAHW